MLKKPREAQISTCEVPQNLLKFQVVFCRYLHAHNRLFERALHAVPFTLMTAKAIMPINVLHCASVARCVMVFNFCASRNWFCFSYNYPQRAKHAINDNFHSYAVHHH